LVFSWAAFKVVRVVAVRVVVAVSMEVLRFGVSSVRLLVRLAVGFTVRLVVGFAVRRTVIRVTMTVRALVKSTKVTNAIPLALSVSEFTETTTMLATFTVLVATVRAMLIALAFAMSVFAHTVALVFAKTTPVASVLEALVLVATVFAQASTVTAGMVATAVLAEAVSVLAMFAKRATVTTVSEATTMWARVGSIILVVAAVADIRVVNIILVVAAVADIRGVITILIEFVAVTTKTTSLDGVIVRAGFDDWDLFRAGDNSSSIINSTLGRNRRHDSEGCNSQSETRRLDHYEL
jgi:hypothetical protein